MALLALLPVFTGLAFYATGLRILQYGLTPERINAVVVVFVLGLYAVLYCYAVIRHRQDWPATIQGVNPMLAAVVVAAAILIQTPVIDAYRISAAGQYQRLVSGDADPATRAQAASFDEALRRHVAANQGEADPARLDESTVERLRSLGYLDP